MFSGTADAINPAGNQAVLRYDVSAGAGAVRAFHFLNRELAEVTLVMGVWGSPYRMSHIPWKSKNILMRTLGKSNLCITL